MGFGSRKPNAPHTTKWAGRLIYITQSFSNALPHISLPYTCKQLRVDFRMMSELITDKHYALSRLKLRRFEFRLSRYKCSTDSSVDKSAPVLI